ESAALDQARVAGLNPDSDAAKAQATSARSAIWCTAIESALAANDHGAASTLYDRAGDSLAPADTAVLRPQLKAAAEIETARDYLGKIAAPPQDEAPTFFDASRLMAEADAQHTAASEQNATDWPDNPTQRATNQHYIDVQFGKQKRGIERTQAQLESNVTNWLTQPMPDGQPQTSRPPLALWTQLSPWQQQSVDAVLAQNARNATAGAQLPAPASPLIGSDEPGGQNGLQKARYAPDQHRAMSSDVSTWGRIAPVDKPSPGLIVELPDGSRIPDPHSPTGYVMSPAPDLGAVAAAGRQAGEGYRARLRNPETHLAAIPYLLAALGFGVGHGGAYDHQREGNFFTGYVQHPQFRNVSNVNVGLFCQQAGLTEDETLRIAGRFAGLFSRNAKPDQPFGLDEDTAKYIKIGFRLGETGMFNPPSTP
ncbi:MAG: hypothetical protein ACHQK9_08510, partial [Reyranellales bacterium]